ncbi:hypothetical protein C0584_00890 [Candidatus Parcubacteria bacterium]|nr:MAG: hypothetical protein C0584_00890 [Candidatus Parcubacteria bacterium]
MKIKKIISPALLFVLLLPLRFVSADNGIFKGINSECLDQGNCTINQIVQTAVNITDILLGLSGSIALLYFVYGGVTFLISGGSAEKVTKGKQILINSIIGLIIIFSSFLIIQYTMTALGYKSGPFGEWNQSK